MNENICVNYCIWLKAELLYYFTLWNSFYKGNYLSLFTITLSRNILLRCSYRVWTSLLYLYLKESINLMINLFILSKLTTLNHIGNCLITYNLCRPIKQVYFVNNTLGCSWRGWTDLFYDLPNVERLPCETPINVICFTDKRWT